jgi:hypothetical protein
VLNATLRDPVRAGNSVARRAPLEVRAPVALDLDEAVEVALAHLPVERCGERAVGITSPPYRDCWRWCM